MASARWERRWQRGDVITRREVLNDGRPWLAVPVHVVEDSAEHLVTYIQTGTRFGFLDGTFPIEGGRHPWESKGSWHGHGTLMVQRPAEDHAVWHFWDGPDRQLVCWYINLQEAFRRTQIGYDTQDLELDIIVLTDGTWAFKDRELLEQRQREGRFTAHQVERVVALGDELAAELDAGRRWWDERWGSWEPDPGWTPGTLPDGWEHVPTA
jgi:hypothetical protein